MDLDELFEYVKCHVKNFNIEATFNKEEIGMAIYKTIDTTWKNVCNCAHPDKHLWDNEVLLDITWEQLHTGHWSDVPLVWRRVYSFASLCKAAFYLYQAKEDHMQEKELFSNALRSVDKGLLMGCPDSDSQFLCDLATQLQSLINKTLPNSHDFEDRDSHKNKKMKHEPTKSMIDIPCREIYKDILQVQLPSIEAFQKIMDNDTPLKLTDCMLHWPAMNGRRWSIPYFIKLAGARTIPVEIGSKYTDDKWTQELMTFQTFVQQYMNYKDKHNSPGYLAQHPLLDQIPQLKNDICIPDYCALGTSEAEINAWIGPEGTVTPLHFDPKHNLLAQVMGSKVVHLFGSSESSKLYPYEGTLLKNTSQVDIECPDLQKFPLFCKATGYSCILNEGDMLYIPPKCWHHVRSLSQSISVSFWWE